MINAALSGLRTADAHFDAAAHKVANVNTRDLGHAPEPEAVPVVDPEVDLAEAMVGTTLASVAYSANLVTLRTANQTVGTLLSIRG